jgi:hypothetical protein
MCILTNSITNVNSKGISELTHDYETDIKKKVTSRTLYGRSAVIYVLFTTCISCSLHSSAFICLAPKIRHQQIILGILHLIKLCIIHQADRIEEKREAGRDETLYMCNP